MQDYTETVSCLKVNCRAPRQSASQFGDCIGRSFDSTCVRNAGWYAATGISELRVAICITMSPSFSCPRAGASPDRHWQCGWSRSLTFSAWCWWSVCHVVVYINTCLSSSIFVQHYGQSATDGISGAVVQQPSANVVALNQSAMGSSAHTICPNSSYPSGVARPFRL